MGDKCAIVSTLSMMKSESNEVVLGGCPRINTHPSVEVGLSA